MCAQGCAGRCLLATCPDTLSGIRCAAALTLPPSSIHDPLPKPLCHRAADCSQRLFLHGRDLARRSAPPAPAADGRRRGCAGRTRCCACRSSRATTSPWCRWGRTPWPSWAVSWAKVRLKPPLSPTLFASVAVRIHGRAEGGLSRLVPQSSPPFSSCLPTCSPSAWAWPNPSGWWCGWRSRWPGAWRCCARVVWFYSRGADALFRVLGMSSLRDDRITSDDILAMMEAGARAGVLAAREQQVITNVFELDTRMVSSAMSPRDRMWPSFLRDEPDSVIRLRIAAEPFLHLPRVRGRHRPCGGLCGCQGPVPARAEQPAHFAGR